jgi:hypothetical protein
LNGFGNQNAQLTLLENSCFHVHIGSNIQSGGKDNTSVTSKQNDNARIVQQASNYPSKMSPRNHDTNVLYAESKDAKTLRTFLEEDGLLDKNYRMTKVDRLATTKGEDDDRILIAVPVIQKAIESLKSQNIPYWADLVIDSGCQKMPFSTAVLGSRKQKTNALMS